MARKDEYSSARLILRIEQVDKSLFGILKRGWVWSTPLDIFGAWQWTSPPFARQEIERSFTWPTGRSNISLSDVGRTRLPFKHINRNLLNARVRFGRLRKTELAAYQT